MRGAIQDRRLQRVSRGHGPGGISRARLHLEAGEGELSKLSKDRVGDNFIRLYLRYVDPNRPQIESGFFEKRSLASLPASESKLAQQFESLVLNNTRRLIERAGVPLAEVVSANPFFQRATRT